MERIVLLLLSTGIIFYLEHHGYSWHTMVMIITGVLGPISILLSGSKSETNTKSIKEPLLDVEVKKIISQIQELLNNTGNKVSNIEDLVDNIEKKVSTIQFSSDKLDSESDKIESLNDSLKELINAITNANNNGISLEELRKTANNIFKSK